MAPRSGEDEDYCMASWAGQSVVAEVERVGEAMGGTGVFGLTVDVGSESEEDGSLSVAVAVVSVALISSGLSLWHCSWRCSWRLTVM